MLAGYKRQNRYMRTLRKFHMQGGYLSKSDYQHKMHVAYYKFIDIRPFRGLRMQQKFKLQRNPKFKDWYNNLVMSGWKLSGIYLCPKPVYTKEIKTYLKRVECPVCNGTGMNTELAHINQHDFEKVKCRECNGHGYIYKDRW